MQHVGNHRMLNLSVICLTLLASVWFLTPDVLGQARRSTGKTVLAAKDLPAAGKAAAGAEAEAPSLITADLLLPETTCLYVSLRDFVQGYQTWKTTELGKFFDTPEMQKAVENIVAQMQGNIDKVQDRLGVTFKEIRQIAAGEIAFGMLLEDAENYAIVAIVDVRDHEVEMRKVLSKITDRVVAEGGKQSKQTIMDADVVFLDIPDKNRTDLTHKVVYVMKDNLLVVSDKREMIQSVLKRIAALKSNAQETLPCLADVDGYLNVLENCVTPEKLPDLVWYMDPIRFAKVQRLIEMEASPNTVRSRSVADMLTASGFGGIEAVGGVVTLKNEGYDGTHRTFISIPKEPQGSLKMLKFPPADRFEIPKWISASVGSLHYVNIDFLNVFDNLGPMINQFFGEGDSKVWDDILEGLEQDPYGPQINLRNDLFAYFGDHLLFVVQNDRPTAPDGERRYVAIPLKDGAKVREALTRLLSEEPTMETVEMPNGQIVWRAVEEEGEEEEGGAASNEEATAKNEKLFPEMSLTVWNGYMLIASHGDVIEAIQKFDPKKTPSLVDSVKFRQVVGELKRFAKGAKCSSIHYRDPARNTQHMYEMFRTGKVAQSTALTAKWARRLIPAVQANAKKAEAKGVVDASSLPEFRSIESYFLPAGATIVNTKKGFLFEGFWLSAEKAKELKIDK